MMDEVIVYIDNVEYLPDSDYGIELTYSKVGGWQLWDIWNKRPSDYKLIGGQWEGKPFCVVINDRVICGSIPKEIVKKTVVGWDGFVRVTL